MPVLTDVQDYAAKLMRALQCVRRDKIHWMIGQKYPYVTPEKIMRRLCHILRIYNDGAYYRWPGMEPDPMRAAAVDVMLILCQGSLPILGVSTSPPCSLLFFVPVSQGEGVLPYRVYTPREGSETECRDIAEHTQKPHGHAAVFVLSDKSQISLLRVSHPHIFALPRGDGTYEFIKPKTEERR